MKILITGVHGFVGSNLVEALSKEHTIYGLDIVSPIKEGIRCTFSWDYLDAEGSIPDIDAIIHLAGKAHDTKNQSAADVYFKVNTELTKKIYDYFLKSKAKKFIFFSSVKAAADRVEGEFVDENVVPSPKGPYGESKIAAEEYIRKMEDVRRKNNKETYILRPCMIHGPGNKGNLNLLYGVVKKGIPWPLGAFENKRTFTSIDNLTYIIQGLLERDVESGIYNINDDEAVSTNELIEIICSAMDKKAHIWRIPRGVMEGVAKLGGTLHLPLNPERLQKLTENYVSSNAKIKKALGIDKLPVRAKDGLTMTIKSFEK
ncbi:NAD-dependent epimerase/dehydratase family protein [Prevotella communis]|uniref:NAD-dependent epimerase/dehydratase family protein n=1 Tax=Prevotella communis TaxID=2913614 RepID=UPI001EDA566F|nr:NAD-dependent epimerase/dehydratase family protein [Prevotella communis]UKK59595.1 NAD-dependent epimerase/dehydratase family protein [Prevotella communis]